MEADMRRFLGPLVFLVLLAVIVPLPAFLWAQGQAQKGQAQRTLDIYFIDTEGGQATLFVTPTGESMLVDTGFMGNQGMPDANATNANGAPITRDADRISAVFKQAGVTVLDWMVISHYHGDHVGNAAELANRIPVRHVVDHGPYSVELQPNRSAAFVAYMAVRDKARAIVAKPGDKIPVGGLDVEVVSSAGDWVKSPVQGAPGQAALGAALRNPLCRDAKLKEQDPTPENVASVGVVVRY